MCTELELRVRDSRIMNQVLDPKKFSLVMCLFLVLSDVPVSKRFVLLEN